jgi:hypothetical protein
MPEQHTRRRLPISVVITTAVSERGLDPTLASLSDFGQVFLVDRLDEDGAPPSASLRALPLDFDWVLFLDAGEVVSSRLAGELSALFHLGVPEHVGYDVLIDLRVAGRKLPFGHRRVMRSLARRDRMTWPVPRQRSSRPSIDGTVGRLRGRLELAAPGGQGHSLPSPRSARDRESYRVT